MQFRILNFVFDQIVEGNDSSDEVADIDHHEFVIGLDSECFLECA